MAKLTKKQLPNDRASEEKRHCGELEGIDDIGSPEDAEWARMVRAWSEGKEIELKAGQGNISGLAKHLSKKYGGDPHLFTSCMSDEGLQEYPEDARAAICAKAHYLALGYWPGDKRNEQKKEEPEIVIADEKNDDWMKALPGYKDEVQLHQDLAEAHAKKTAKLKRKQ